MTELILYIEFILSPITCEVIGNPGRAQKIIFEGDHQTTCATENSRNIKEVLWTDKDLLKGLRQKRYSYFPLGLRKLLRNLMTGPFEYLLSNISITAYQMLTHISTLLVDISISLSQFHCGVCYLCIIQCNVIYKLLEIKQNHLDCLYNFYE